MSQTITNHWGKARTSKIAGRRTMIHRASSWSASYSHHPQLLAHGGKLWATWSLGFMNEDTPGQHMVYSVSKDDGETWTAPATLVPAAAGEHAPSVVTSMGLYASGETLAAFYASFEFTLDGLTHYPQHGCNSRYLPGLRCLQKTHTGILRSEDAGEHWSGPVATIPGIIPNFSPVRLSTGRLILPGNRAQAWSDDPAGLSGWTIAPLPGMPANYHDAAGGEIRIEAPWSRLGICEGSVYELPDGVVRLMFRTNRAVLAACESRDFGVTWSAPEATEFTDCGARFQFGRLPDGRYFALSCPDPNIPQACLRRTPLVLATSKDGNVFDRHYVLGDEPDRPLNFPGAYKHGRYGYPYCIVVADWLYVIYSVAKEDIELAVYCLADLT